MLDPKELGSLIRDLRSNESLRSFASRCGISHTTIDNLEKGYDFRTGKAVQVKVETLHKIAVACGVPVSLFLDGKPAFACNLVELRAISNETQEYVANCVGISRQAYSNYERGIRDPDTDTLKRLAEHFQVSVDFILGYSIDRKPATEGDGQLDEARELFSRLSPEAQAQVLNYMKFLEASAKDS